jgi:peptidoglycan-N-acetylglucosamine deacetylase
MAQPVFYDPQRARWRRLRRLLDTAGIVLSVVVVVFVYSALHNEPLPKLFLEFQKHPYHALKETERQKASEKRAELLRRGHRKSKLPPSQVELNTDEGIRAAFYVPWDAASFSSLREYARQIDLLYPVWLHVLTPDGRLQSIDEQSYPPKTFDIVQTGAVHPIDDKVMSFLKSENTGTEVFPLVNNSDGANWVDISAFLNDANARALFRQQVAMFLASDKYRGLMVDFEDFPVKAQPAYLQLLNELSQDLHAKGQKLYVSVPARSSDFNYKAISDVTDGVVLMNYDEHYTGPGGGAGPIASQDWFTNNLVEAKKAIPLDKLICGIANYGYDWVQPPKRGSRLRGRCGLRWRQHESPHQLHGRAQPAP